MFFDILGNEHFWSFLMPMIRFHTSILLNNKFGIMIQENDDCETLRNHIIKSVKKSKSKNIPYTDFICVSENIFQYCLNNKINIEHIEDDRAYNEVFFLEKGDLATSKTRPEWGLCTINKKNEEDGYFCVQWEEPIDTEGKTKLHHLRIVDIQPYKI